ncbi:beta-lactamase family protein [Streptomyces albus subsp. chlorinus]|uniref:serine hydrolase n=1 Tax=Streptomyces albus TaxID=1888 RepID=UPI00156F2993|nr:beta-lactamase family protein [Streptomyces albus subsp. chlorinus]
MAEVVHTAATVHGTRVAVHGTVAEGYEPVRDAFVRNFAERGEKGAAVAVHRDGRAVVDLWGGTTDPADPQAPPWSRETAVVVRSATKGLAAAVPHLLHQRGQLDLDAPVGSYWPEFKTAGKERLLVRHLLAHRAGLPVPAAPLTPAEALHPGNGPRVLAAQAPEWEPGTAHGYHAHTFGWLLAELVVRASGGRSLGRWFADEIAGPLGLDVWIGLPDEVAASGRVARVAELPAPEAVPGALRTRPKRSVTDAYADPRSLTRRAFDAITPRPDENDPAYRAAELPAANGIATARSLSAFYAALLGPLEGRRRLFTPATLTQARSLESDGPDRVLVINTRFGLGYMLHGSACPMLGPGSFGHPGRGGSLGFADPETGTSFGYVTNTLHRSVTSDPRPQSLVRALRAAVGSAT